MITKEELAAADANLSNALERYNSALIGYMRQKVGTFCRDNRDGRVYRISDVGSGGFTLLGLMRGDFGINGIAYSTWGFGADGPLHTDPISCDEYLAVAGPLFNELAKLAGIEATAK